MSKRYHQLAAQLERPTQHGRGRFVLSAQTAGDRGVWRRKYVYEGGRHVLKVYYIGYFDGKWYADQYAHAQYLADKAAIQQRKELGLGVALTLPDTERGDVLFGPRLDTLDTEGDQLRLNAITFGSHNKSSLQVGVETLSHAHHENNVEEGAYMDQSVEWSPHRDDLVAFQPYNDNSMSSLEETLRLDWLGWSLPRIVREAYMAQGVHALYSWQAECLRKPGILTGKRNLVLSAPTSGGKTLIGELMIIHRVLTNLFEARESMKVATACSTGLLDTASLTPSQPNMPFLSTRRVSMVVVPYVALVSEKAAELKLKLQPLGISVEACQRGVPLSQHDLFERVDVLVCTIEKAYMITNHFLQLRTNQCKLDLVIIDEAHLVTERGRGATLELLLAKLLYLQAAALSGKSNAVTSHQTLWPQLVCMSSSLPGLQEMGKWLDADVFVASEDVRPIPLQESVFCAESAVRQRQTPSTSDPRGQKQPWSAYTETRITMDPKICYGELIPKSDIPPTATTASLPTQIKRYYSTQSYAFPKLATSVDPQYDDNSLTPFSSSMALLELVAETLNEGCSVIIFAPTKALVESTALSLSASLQSARNSRLAHSKTPCSSHILDHLWDEKRTARLDLMKQAESLSEGCHPILPSLITEGIAPHHAGLTTTERQLIEEGFKSGTLNVLVATSTLAMGVNLPARRVIICAPSTGPAPLDPARYRQMAGRAGRAGLDTKGECILLVRTPAEFEVCRSLLHAPLPQLESVLLVSKHTIRQAVLELIYFEAAGDTAALTSSGEIFNLQQDISDHSVSSIHAAVPASRITSLLKQTLAWSLAKQRDQTGSDRDSTACKEVIASYKGELRTLVRLGLLELVPVSNSDASNSMRYSEVLLRPTHLGRLTATSGISSSEAILQLQLLARTLTHIAPGSLLQLCFHAQPFDQSSPNGQGWYGSRDSTQIASNRLLSGALVEPDWTQLAWRISQHLDAKELAILETFLHLDWKFLERARETRPLVAQNSEVLWSALEDHFQSNIISSSSSSKLNDEIAAAWKHRLIYQAILINELAGDRALTTIQSRWGCERGALQTLHHHTILSCNILCNLCEAASWRSLAILFANLRERLGRRLDTKESFGLQAYSKSPVVSSLMNSCMNPTDDIGLGAALAFSHAKESKEAIIECQSELCQVIQPIALHIGVSNRLLAEHLKLAGIESLDQLAMSGAESSVIAPRMIAETIGQQRSFQLEVCQSGWQAFQGQLALDIEGDSNSTAVTRTKISIPDDHEVFVSSPYAHIYFRALWSAANRAVRILGSESSPRIPIPTCETPIRLRVSFSSLGRVPRDHVVQLPLEVATVTDLLHANLLRSVARRALSQQLAMLRSLLRPILFSCLVRSRSEVEMSRLDILNLQNHQLQQRPQQQQQQQRKSWRHGHIRNRKRIRQLETNLLQYQLDLRANLHLMTDQPKTTMPLGQSTK